MQQQRTKQYARKTTSANPPRADDPDYDLEYGSSPSFIEEDSEPSAAFLASSVPTSSSAVPKPRTKQTARKSTGIWIPRRVDDDGRVFNVDEEADEHPGYFDTPMEDYSTNIKDDLKNVLQECKKSAGSFYSNCSYSNAPNPGLSVDGVGVIGLPLSEPEAKRLIKKCTQARFGKGERTVLDKSVRDTWEVDTKKVNLLNPQWETWMRETALPSVCKEMNVSESEVDAELYKLLLYEKGSHFLAHQDTEKTTGMFATLVVVLPSKFDGGVVQLTHTGQTSVIDIASSSLLETHVLSWYTDVFHAVLPIESGYRLALSYNVKQRLAGPKPRLLDQNEMSVGLNRVMKSWRQAADGVLPIQVPDKIIYTLEHEYSERDLRSTKLKGADEKLLNELIPIASELRFGLYIAHFELHQRGWAKETFESYNRSYDADEVSMQEVDEDQTCFTYIVDLSGREKRGVDLCIDDDTEVIPEPLGRGKPQKAEFGGFTGNEGGTLEYWYHKSVLILCPYHELFGVEVQEDYACRMLMKSNSTSPTKLEQTCVSRVLMACNCEGVTETEVREAIEALLRSALRWKDLELWLLAANACPEEERLERIKHHVLEACRQWPFKKLEGICESSLKHDGSNGVRLSLLDDLQNASIEWNDKYLSKWCDRQLGLVLSSLRAPKVDEIDSFIKVCMNKGVEFIKNILIPHFKEWECDNAFWAAFLKSIKQHKDSIGSSNSLDGIVSVLTSDIVSRSKVFPSLTHGWYREEFDMKAWEGLVELVLMSGDANVFKDLCKPSGRL
ncbi:hypothetical protein SCHPADRAFT_303662 [Schizopora paradoxa]|uniref:Uncharacterized protein n=1 Tax=Schizopora paradoxa TaxID=27342 RepID=A0A0H2RRW5_9AGAM|nr:hypothetical protein SCHPADRAFT_303662 [Schizopora paradoxa]